jgi:transcriptional regulator with XRE-family HTH domain
MKSFAKLLSEACKRQGVSYSELARALGYSQPRISQLMKSKSVSERIFKEAAGALDLDVRVELVPMSKARERMTIERLSKNAGRLGRSGNGRK